MFGKGPLLIEIVALIWELSMLIPSVDWLLQSRTGVNKIVMKKIGHNKMSIYRRRIPLGSSCLASALFFYENLFKYTQEIKFYKFNFREVVTLVLCLDRLSSFNRARHIVFGEGTLGNLNKQR